MKPYATFNSCLLWHDAHAIETLYVERSYTCFPVFQA